jgi:hypothetical protein
MDENFMTDIQFFGGTRVPIAGLRQTLLVRSNPVAAWNQASEWQHTT